MINELPQRLRDIAETVDDWNAPLGARVDLLEAAREIERLKNQQCQGYTHSGTCATVEEIRREIERLNKIIRDFCAKEDWAVERWKNQEHIKPLFDEARKDKG